MLTQVVAYVNCKMTKRMFSLKIREKVEHESSQKLCKVKKDNPFDKRLNNLSVSTT